MGENFFIVEDLTSERAEFFPVGEVLIHCLPVGARRRPGQSPMQYLDRLAHEARVRPLSEFIGEAADSYFGEGKARATGSGLPTSRWFIASEGLVTIRGLLNHLTIHTELVAELKSVMSELRQLENVLLEWEKKGARWHLEDGSWW
jgi:hypothetical protein